MFPTLMILSYSFSLLLSLKISNLKTINFHYAEVEYNKVFIVPKASKKKII